MKIKKESQLRKIFCSAKSINTIKNLENYWVWRELSRGKDINVLKSLLLNNNQVFYSIY
jgi:hypothetical protein